MLAVSAARPDSRYLARWVPDWLEPEGALESLPDKLAMAVLGQVVNSTAEPATRLRLWPGACRPGAAQSGTWIW